MRLRLRQHPLRRLEADVLADAQLPVFPLQQIAHDERIALLPQHAPRIVFVQRVHVAALLIVLRFGSNGTGNVRRPAELLPRRILHAVDPIERHGSHILTEVASFRPISIQRSTLLAFHTTASRREPRRREGSTRVTSMAAVARRPCMTRWSSRNPGVFSTFNARARRAPNSSAAHNGSPERRPPST